MDNDDKRNNNSGVKRRKSLKFEEGVQTEDSDHIIVVRLSPNRMETVDNTGDGAVLEFESPYKHAQSVNILEYSIEPHEEGMNIAQNNASPDIGQSSRCLNWPSAESTKDVLDEPLTHTSGVFELWENDPMDLLEIDQRSEIGERDAEDHDDESDSTRSPMSNNENINDWMKEYAWLLYDGIDEYYGYCLHCDVTLSIRSYSSVKQHALSLYHKERSDNYLEFQNEEEKFGLSTPLMQIKQEFGTDSRTEALKFKRKTQVEALSNFNWRRWLKLHSWLDRGKDRDNLGDTIGFCKFCRVTLNVEFAYLRERHEASTKHKDAEKAYKTNECIVGGVNEKSNEADHNNLEQSDDDDNDGDDHTDSHDNQSQMKEWKFRELLENNRRLCRCIACNISLYRCNFARHASTLTHKVNSRKYRKTKKELQQKINNKSMQVEPTSSEEKVKAESSKFDWHIYTKKHPWLTSYAKDKFIAYCLYCKKRLLYGKSSSKMIMHENSIAHKQCEIMYKKEHNADVISNKNQLSSNNDNKSNSDRDENDYENANNEDGNDIRTKEYNENVATKKYKNKLYGNVVEWSRQYVWCRPYVKKPEKYYYCIYCKMVLSINFARSRHESSTQHKLSEKEHFHNRDQEKELSEIHSWAVCFRNAPSTYYCKYCKIRLSAGTLKSKHAKTKNHLLHEKIWKKKHNEMDTSGNPNDKSDKMSLESEPDNRTSYQSMIKLWRTKYPWLTYRHDEVRSFYAYCDFCQKSIYVRTTKNAIRHQKTSGHLSQMRLKQNETLKQQQAQQQKHYEKDLQKNTQRLEKMNDKPESSNLRERSNSYDGRLETLQKRFAWAEASTIQNYVYCRQCDTHILRRFAQVKTHHYSEEHRKNNSLHPSLDNNTRNSDKSGTSGNMNVQHKNVNHTTSHVDMSDDTNMCDVLKDSDNVSNNGDQNYQNDSPKRVQKHSDKGTTLTHESRLTLSKRFKRIHNDEEYYDSRQVMTDILNTPLTLSNYLGPLIQQQIQQTNLAQNLNQSSNEKSTQRESPSKEHSFDLFFRSISETMKKLPPALAAEGKVKIMQIICELELKALKDENKLEKINESNICKSPNTSNTHVYVEEPSSINTNSNVQGDSVNKNPTIPISSPSSSSTSTSTSTSTSLTKVSLPVIGVTNKGGLQSIYFNKLEEQINLISNVNNSNTTTSNNNGPTHSAIQKLRCLPIQSLPNANFALQIKNAKESPRTQETVVLNNSETNNSNTSNMANNNSNIALNTYVRIAKKGTIPSQQGIGVQSNFPASTFNGPIKSSPLLLPTSSSVIHASSLFPKK